MPAPLLSPDVLVFAAPIAVAVVLWGLMLLGVGPDGDGDAPGGDAAGGGGDLLGLGSVPPLVAGTVLLFAFGWAGLAFRFGAGWGLGLSVAAAVPAGLALTAGATRLLRPVFREDRAPDRRALVGHVGVVTSERVGPDFGTATVRLDGARVEVAVRLDDGDAGPADTPPADAPRYGQRVLLYGFDADRNVYRVAAHADD